MVRYRLKEEQWQTRGTRTTMKTKALKNPVNSIAKATLLILQKQILHQYIPDFCIKDISFPTGLTDKEVREIRDLIQSDFKEMWEDFDELDDINGKN